MPDFMDILPVRTVVGISDLLISKSGFIVNPNSPPSHTFNDPGYWSMPLTNQGSAKRSKSEEIRRSDSEETDEKKINPQRIGQIQKKVTWHEKQLLKKTVEGK